MRIYSPPAPFCIGDTLPLPLAGKLFLLFHFLFSGKKWFSKPLLAYLELCTLKKYSIDIYFICRYIPFENLIKNIFLKGERSSVWNSRD